VPTATLRTKLPTSMLPLPESTVRETESVKLPASVLAIGSATLPKMPTVGPMPQTGSPSTLTFAPANALVPLTPAPTLSFAKLPTDTE
jgi:hypothetical protein